MHHVPISPAILYWGTTVVLITTNNPPEFISTEPTSTKVSTNIGPMSSVWWIGRRCMLGLGALSATTQNLLRTRQCVLNLPSDDMAPIVNSLARTTGSSPVPPHKIAMGYRHEPDKFRAAGVTPIPSSLVSPPRIAQCPVAMECILRKKHTVLEDEAGRAGAVVALECEVVKIWIDEGLRMKGHANRVDPDLWRPLIMSFQELYGVSGKKADRASVLAGIEEESYRRLSGKGEDYVEKDDEAESLE